MPLISCKQCMSSINVDPGTDPHSLTWCQCCSADHHHGADVLPADQCEAANHPGQQCWHPPDQPVRPDGCTVCRPVIHHANANEIFLTVN